MKNIIFTTKKKLLSCVFLLSLFLVDAMAVPGWESVLGEDDARKVNGLILDNFNEPLIGVSIAVTGTSRGTITDVNGKFELDVRDEDNEIMVSYIGYKTLHLKLDGRSFYKIVMQENSTLMDEVVIIGYGKQSRQTLTSTVSKLDNEVLKHVPYTNVSSALQGNIPGLRVQSTTGQPGSSSRIVLRGGTSINNPNGSAPLYIVDGVVRESLEDINADNIESIDVLKDASATAIYGARGSNGVILISTKEGGSSGKSTVNYRYSLTLSKIGKRYEMANAKEYIYYNRIGMHLTGQKRPNYLNLLNGATGYGVGNDLTNHTAYNVMYLNDDNKHKLNQDGWQTMEDPLDPSKTILFKETDWQDVLFRTGISHNHYLSFSGGTEKANMFASVGYMTAEGTTITTKYERLTVDVSGNLKVSPTIGLDAKVNFSNSSNNAVYSNNQIFQRALALAPTAKYTYEDGTLAPGQNRTMGNPAYHLNRRKTYDNSNKLSISLGGYWNILPGLKFEPRALLYVEQDITNFFQASYWDGPNKFVDNREMNASHSLKWQRQFDATLSYVKSFNNVHNISVSGGSSYYNVIKYWLKAGGEKATTDNIPTMNAAAVATLAQSSVKRQAIYGYFARLSYDYDRKYLFSASFRSDGASNLGKNNRWGFFPGVSGGWNVHNEGFWSELKSVVSTLKPRVSYGVNGNISGLTEYHAQGEYSLSGTYNGESVAMIARMKNDDLKWEESKTVNVGLDLGFVDNRFNILFDAYRRKTNNLLTDLNLPKETGFPSVKTNYGSLENKGIELAITANIVEAKKEGDLSIDMGFNISHNANKILKLPANGNDKNRVGGIYIYDRSVGDYVWAGGLQEGGSLGDLYAYRQLGIYATDEEASQGPVDNLVNADDKTKYGGDVIWDDIDGNNVIDERDRVKVGNIYPDWTGGMNASLTFAGFSLNIRTDFALGHTIYNESRARFLGQFQGDINTLKEVNNTWQKEGDASSLPRYWWSDQVAQNNIYRGNSAFYEKGDYFALREITLGYNVPQKWLKNIFLKDAFFSITGSNLAYLTKYKGLAPEDGGTDNGRYPLPRTVTFNFNVKF